MTKNRAAIVALCLFGAGGVYFLLRNGKPNVEKPSTPHSEATPAAVTTSEPTPAPTKAPAKLSPLAAASAKLDASLRALANASPDEARRILAELRAYLTSLPPDVAKAALQTFLGQGQDAATRLGFSIEKDGHLKEAPTLRVWLLDCLSAVDKQAAADYAKTILASSASADEWAICLRDFASVRNSPDDVAFVQNKIREMLGNPDWLKNPSSGFLEAFDAIVYTHGDDFTPDLAKLVTDKDNRAVAHAAYLTLDRLVIQDPATVLAQLESNPQMMEGREATRANYFARADVRDQQQLSVLETYLLDPARTPQELQTFAGLYPSANYMISNNLLTPTATPTRDDLVAQDRQTLQQVDQWLADPRFANLAPQLQKIRSRVATFVQQANNQPQ
jgi:hypothetical protein